jgi:HK97 gp10 family phage protein
VARFVASTTAETVSRGPLGRAALERALRAGVRGARRRAPVRKGVLRDSITGEIQGGRAVWGSDVDYAAYQELGTFKMPAHPYLRPSLDDVRAAFRGLG